MICIYYQYHIKKTNSSISPFVNSKDEVDFAMLFPLWASLFELGASPFGLRPHKTTQHGGKAGGLQILRC
jgi:hypothetical protein